MYKENIINDWKPIKVNSVPILYDITIRVTRWCSLHRKLRQEYLKMYMKRSESEKHLKTLKDLSTFVGKPITTFSDAAYIYDALKTEKHQNKT